MDNRIIFMLLFVAGVLLSCEKECEEVTKNFPPAAPKWPTNFENALVKSSSGLSQILELRQRNIITQNYSEEPCRTTNTVNYENYIGGFLYPVYITLEITQKSDSSYLRIYDAYSNREDFYRLVYRFEDKKEYPIEYSGTDTIAPTIKTRILDSMQIGNKVYRSVLEITNPIVTKKWPSSNFQYYFDNSRGLIAYRQIDSVLWQMHF